MKLLVCWCQSIVQLPKRQCLFTIRWDQLDQNVSYQNNVDNKTYKWWKRLFTWIIENTQIKTAVMYTLTDDRESKKTIKIFQTILLKTYMEELTVFNQKNFYLLEKK